MVNVISCAIHHTLATGTLYTTHQLVPSQVSKERERNRQTDRKKERETHTQRQTEKETE